MITNTIILQRNDLSTCSVNTAHLPIKFDTCKSILLKSLYIAIHAWYHNRAIRIYKAPLSIQLHGGKAIPKFRYIVIL